MRYLVQGIIVITLAVTGCGVNKDIYQKSVDESEMRRAQLEKTQIELDQARLNLDDVNRENEQTRKQINDIAEVSVIESRKLNDEITALKQTKDSGIGEIESLRVQNEQLSKEVDYYRREVERLSVKTGEISTEKEKELSEVKNTYDNLVKELQAEIDKGDIKITQAVDRLSVNLVEKILFDSGKAEVKADGLKVLKRVGDILKGITDKEIRIEGHTDNVPIGVRIKQKYASNWELSAARAINVVRYLQEKVGVSPHLLSPSGLSQYRPVASNEVEADRSQNRRIEIILLPMDIGVVIKELKK